jgi:cell fate regulator YaaT (PSP1 superfamily)
MLAIELERVGKPHLYPKPSFETKRGDPVVVETARGTELGKVISSAIPFVGEAPADAFRVLRTATVDDLKADYQNRLECAEAFEQAKHAINRMGLEMRLLETRLTLNHERIIFFFWAEGRVDFRALVKELVGMFRKRIELYQIGSRDRAKMIGGIGPCGLTCCCTLWLREFSSISIRLAREQQLHVKPDKISGVCGRLMCCLRYEYETYRALRQELPAVGSDLDTPDGVVRILDVDPIGRTLLVRRGHQAEESGGEVYRIPLGRARIPEGKGCTSCASAGARGEAGHRDEAGEA